MPTLIVFAREPQPGRVKTRLAAVTGEATAYRLYLAFLRDLAEHVRQLPADFRVTWWVAGECAGLKKAVGSIWSPHWRLLPQPSGSLGARLEAAFAATFARDSVPVGVIGSDCPQLQTEQLKDLFSPMDKGVDAVLLPSRDGGYAGLALASPCMQAFRDVPWSTPNVTTATLAILRELGRTVAVLPPVFDVDTAPDLQDLGYLLADRPELAPHTADLLAAGRLLPSENQ